jgi:hypothetical protein
MERAVAFIFLTFLALIAAGSVNGVLLYAMSAIASSLFDGLPRMPFSAAVLFGVLIAALGGCLL